MVAWVGYEPAIQVLTHDADLVAVLINVRAVFAVIRPLILQPAEALHIDHVAGLEICGRLRWGGFGRWFRLRRWLHFGSRKRFHGFRLRFIDRFMGRL